MKKPVCIKLYPDIISRIEFQARKHGISKNCVIDDALERRLDELEGHGWEHPVCAECYYYSGAVCGNNKSPCYNALCSNTFYCPLWEERTCTDSTNNS